MQARVVLALVGVLLIGADAPQQDSVKILARNVDLDDAVVVLDIPAKREGKLFYIAVVEPNGRYSGGMYRARPGRHAYDPRGSLDAWKGRAALVVTSALDGEGVVRIPTLDDEIDLFLEPAIQRPNIINALPPLRFCTVSWNHWVLAIWGLAAVVGWYATKRVSLAALTGFLIAWAAADARTVVDRYENVRWHEKNGHQMMFLEHAVEFASTARPFMHNHTWTTDGSLDTVPLMRNYLLGYAFADQRYVGGKGHDEPADFVVTTDPKSAPVVCSVGGLFLVRGGSR